MISICIPCYNVEKYIERCLDNLLSQTYKDIEIICVDDGSFDNTLQILFDYKIKNNNSNIKIIHHIRNHKLLMARKTAVFAASGKYIMFLDPDDLLEENALQVLVEIMDRSSFDIVEFRGRSWDFQVEPVKLINESYCPSYKGSLFNEEIFEIFITNKLGQMIWNKIYRKEIVLKVYSLLRLNELYMREDIYFCCILFAVIKSYHGIEDILHKYSINSGKSRDKPLFDLSKFDEDCKAGDIVYSLIEIYYENFTFDKSKFFLIKYKIDRWMKQINNYNLRGFLKSDDFNKAVEIFSLKWINLDLINKYIKTNNSNLIETCNYLISSYFSVAAELVKIDQGLVFNKVIRRIVSEICNSSLISLIDSNLVSMFTKVNISIFGSCVCRDVFNCVENDCFNIIKYINGVSPFSLYSDSPPLFLNPEDLYINRSNFEKRSCCIDWNKNFNSFFSINHKNSDIFIVDLCDARLPIGKIFSSQVFDFYFSYGSTFIDSYRHDKIKHKLDKINFQILDPLQISDSDWMKCIENYSNFIINNLFPKKIIIIQTMFAEQYLDNSTIKIFDNIEYIRKLNGLYAKLYGYLRNYLKIDYSVIELPKFLLADKNHRLGLHPVHYTSNTYKYILDQIHDVIFS